MTEKQILFINAMPKLQYKFPALRFPGFSGEWNKVKLLEMSSLITKGTTPKNFVAEGINFIKIECFVGSIIDKNKCLFIDEKTHAKELKRSILQEGDILFAIAGATIGKCNIVTKEVLPANTNQALAIIRLKDQNSLSFVYNNLRSALMQKYILDNISVGAQPNLNLEQMGNFSFFLPSLPEQQKIASFLTVIDAKIELLTKKKALLEQYKKGVMQQLFSQQIRFKDEEGNDLPEWKVCKLEDITTWASGGTPAKEVASYWNGNIPWISASSMRGNKYSSSELKLTNEGVKNGSKIAISGTILLLVRGSMLFNTIPVGITTKDVAFNQDVKSITVKKGVLANYILNWFIASENKLLDMVTVTGIGAGKLDTYDLKQLSVNIPTIEEQQKIIDFIDIINYRIEKIVKELELVKTYKKGLLQQLFI